MREGIVKWFNAAKGFGFILQDGESDVFVHYKSINGDGYKTLSEGDRVQYEIEDGPKGALAKNVSKISGEGSNGESPQPKTSF